MNSKTTINRLALCLTAASVLAACSGYLDESEGFSTSLGNAIEVNAMIGNTADAQTRVAYDASSSEVTTATLTSFWMWGYNGKTAIKGINGTDSVALSDCVFTDATTKGSFTDGVTYYWPTAQVKFIAVSSTQSTDPTLADKSPRQLVVASTGVTATDFEVEESCKLADFVNQEDYIVAVNKTAKPATSNKINLTFQHMLSRVSINAYAPGFTTKHPSLACFGFDGVQKTGTFTYTGNSTDKPFYYADGASGDKCWSAAAETGLVGSKYTPKEDSYNTSEYYWYSSDAFQVTATSQPTDAKRLAYSSYIAPWLNVIPGSSVASTLYITLWYEGSAWPFEIDLSTINGSLTEYKPGYQYIYNIQISGSSDSEGEKVRPQVEIYSVTVAEWNSEAATATIDAPAVAAGKTLKAQIEEAQDAGSKNIEVSLTTTAVSEVTITSQISITTNVVIDLNSHNLTPAVPNDAQDNIVAAFKVSGGHRLAIKGTGTVTVSDFKKLFELASETDLTNTFAIRGGTWTIDPQQYVPGYSGTAQEYATPEGGSGYQISCSSDSWNYTIIRSGSGTSEDPYTYTVYEATKS